MVGHQELRTIRISISILNSVTHLDGRCHGDNHFAIPFSIRLSKDCDLAAICGIPHTHTQCAIFYTVHLIMTKFIRFVGT